MKRYLLIGAAGFAMLVALGVRTGHSHGEHHDHHPEAQRVLKRSVPTLTVPRAALIRSDGASVDLKEELQDTRPVFLNFIYTTCTTVCPVMSQVFAQLQEVLGKDRNKVLLISVSIDPDYDTPERLAAYARQFDARPQWRFYTGTADASITVQKAFGVYTRDRMSHPVATFYRPAPDRAWVRIDGFATPPDLEREYRSEAKGHEGH